VKRWTRLLSLLLVAACSGLEEGEGGVVAVEVETPEFQNLEVGEQVQVVARALDIDGAVVDVPLEWQASSAAVTVDDTGLVTGVQPGTADVQAISGSLPSESVAFTVVARADTVIISGDSVVTIPIGADPPVTATLTVRVETFTPPAGPLSNSPVIFEITSPLAGDTVVQLAGEVQIDTVTTATDGTAAVVIGEVSGQVPPDTAIVQVRAERTRGSAVPGSGQRFIVLFQ
jgi:Bacterial Ig-like domain (group 2)